MLREPHTPLNPAMLVGDLLAEPPFTLGPDEKQTRARIGELPDQQTLTERPQCTHDLDAPHHNSHHFSVLTRGNIVDHEPVKQSHGGTQHPATRRLQMAAPVGGPDRHAERGPGVGGWRSRMVTERLRRVRQSSTGRN